MKFALRYVFRIFKETFITCKPILVFLASGGFLLGVAITTFRGFTAQNILDPLIFAMWGAIIYLIIIAAGTGFEFTQNYKLQKLLNDKGVCSEYIYAYGDTHIKNKPHSDSRCIFYANALSRMGNWQEALDVLESVDTSKLDLTLMTVYLHAYMMTAVSMGNPALADKVWTDNQGFIITNMNKPYFGNNTALMYQAMVFVDCAAGRYERAYETCVNYMKSPMFRADSAVNMDFIDVMIYLLKHFGKEKELSEVLSLWEKRFKKCRFFYDSERNIVLKDREKALNGILPV